MSDRTLAIIAIIVAIVILILAAIFKNGDSISDASASTKQLVPALAAGTW
jgi:uncharacterized membrane protein YvbJ